MNRKNVAVNKIVTYFKGQKKQNKKKQQKKKNNNKQHDLTLVCNQVAYIGIEIAFLQPTRKGYAFIIVRDRKKISNCILLSGKFIFWVTTRVKLITL